LRLICDANIGSIIARALAGQGHDVIRAIYVVPHADDDVVLRYAVDNDRVLVTCDGDFGELVFRRGALPPPAIIYVRFEPPEVGEIVPRLLAVLDFDLLKDHMTVIGEHGNRRTAFPGKSVSHG
jgi:predicted nuclease of predicted toxin-antitoxin system